jgi:hypothetical protein
MTRTLLICLLAAGILLLALGGWTVRAVRFVLARSTRPRLAVLRPPLRHAATA